VQQATGAFLPTLSLGYSESKSGTTDITQRTLNVNMPLGAGTFFARQGAQANYLKAKENSRDIEQKSIVQVEQLRSQVDTGLQALEIQLDAIKARSSVSKQTPRALKAVFAVLSMFSMPPRPFSK
jgi:outer membrane protein TolC